jgi:L-fuconolactonase
MLGEAARMQLIDSHVHLWRIGRNGQAWPGADLPEIHRDFVEADLVEASRGQALAGVIVVQSQPNDEDTDWLISLAAASRLILGVVGWADFTAPDAVSRIEALARTPKLRGLRPMLQAIAADDWILRPEAAPALHAMERLGLVFDALVQPRHLPHIARLADRYPDLRIVIDHGAKPAIAAGAREPWRSQLAEAARRANVFCKLSGLSTECSPLAAEAARPFIADILSIFPDERILWGSDWPVVNTNSNYQEWSSICLQATNYMTNEQRENIFTGSASLVYRLGGLH